MVIQKKDSRIKVIHQKNAGVSVARNVGTSEAEGEYVILLNNDTEVDEKFTKELLNAIKEDEKIFSCSFIFSVSSCLCFLFSVECILAWV